MEILTGVAELGPKTLFASLGRIGQAVLKSDLQWGVMSEMKRLTDAGKLPPNLGEAKHGLHTWVELMSIIDNECPDAERLEALKAMFYAVNKINQAEIEHVLAYQLWNVAKGLKSGELVLLKTINEKSMLLGNIPYHQWQQQVAQASGLLIVELVELHLMRLRELNLAVAQVQQSRPNGGITNLGMRLCKNIETYTIDLSAAEEKLK
jgi:hypothetical protein